MLPRARSAGEQRGRPVAHRCNRRVRPHALLRQFPSARDAQAASSTCVPRALAQPDASVLIHRVPFLLVQVAGAPARVRAATAGALRPRPPRGGVFGAARRAPRAARSRKRPQVEHALCLPLRATQRRRIPAPLCWAPARAAFLRARCVPPRALHVLPPCGMWCIVDRVPCACEHSAPRASGQRRAAQRACVVALATLI
jgi:hypothetical protein